MFWVVCMIGISLFIPPFWIITIGYIIYLISTKKKRRNRVLFNEIIKSIALKREQVVLNYLYFEAAKSFAVDHGAVLSKFNNDPSDNTLIVYLTIGGEDYKIILQLWMKDETLLSVYSA